MNRTPATKSSAKTGDQVRHLVLVLGDQLSLTSSALNEFDQRLDQVWMAENDEEATHVWCHKYRLVAFFAPMRHFADTLREKGYALDYHQLTGDRRKARGSSFASLLSESIKLRKPKKVIMTQPGDYRVLQSIRKTCAEQNVTIEVRTDLDFYCSIERFAQWSSGRKSMVLEQFYRVMRAEHDILMKGKGEPLGGQWNFDKDNRKPFGKQGPKNISHPRAFKPDAVTREVMVMVEQRFADHPGSLESFDLPVDRQQALQSLDDFIENRLPFFGDYQDAMWQGTDFLYHSRLSHALNLHLLSPREVVEAAVTAFEEDRADLTCVEGFVRQILGWREFVRGVYWQEMPSYAERNALACDTDQEVPSFFWDGQTEMACVRDAMRLLIDTSYAHHIQRLMVLGLYSQLLGVHPLAFHQWHMAMYSDAIDWVSLPNALGMSQFGDGGIIGTKPYCASGNYINGMSNYCKGCRYNPKLATGDEACPFTTLYWNFLARHRERFRQNPRMTMQLKNLERKDSAELHEIASRAAKLQSGQISP